MVPFLPEALPKGSLAAAQLRREILSGELPEGTPLRQAALAHRLGCSTIPIREALRWLTQEGLVVTHPFQGATVARLVPEELLQFARVRIALETEALAIALPFHTPLTLAEARRRLDEVRNAPGVDSHFDRYARFLKALYEPGGHTVLVAEILKIVDQSHRYAVLNPAIVELLPRDLPRPQDILFALEAGDLALAQACLRLLYLHSSIIGASILYQRQLEIPSAQRRPRGRPRKVQP